MSAAVTSERHADVERFLQAARSWLLESEVENNLLLGIALNRRPAEPDQAPPYSVYAKIGYRPVRDEVEIEFDR